jgi:hypothetical protein
MFVNRTLSISTKNGEAAILSISTFEIREQSSIKDAEAAGSITLVDQQGEIAATIYLHEGSSWHTIWKSE